MKKEYLFVIIAGILAGIIVFGGQLFANMGLSLYQISLFPVLISTIILGFLMFNKKYRPKNALRPIWILYGFVCALTVFAQYAAILLGLPVSLVVLLLYTQPLWTIIISRIFMKEKVTIKNLIACTLVLLGVFILVNPLHAGAIKSWLGVLIALIGGLSLSGWIVIGSHVSKSNHHPITSSFLTLFYTTLIMLIIYPFAHLLLKNPNFISLSFNLAAPTWFYLIIFALFINLGTQLFYLYGVIKVPAVDAGIIMMLEPVVGTILAAIFLSQAVTWNVIFGGILILFANYLVIKNH